MCHDAYAVRIRRAHTAHVRQPGTSVGVRHTKWVGSAGTGAVAGRFGAPEGPVPGAVGGRGLGAGAGLGAAGPTGAPRAGERPGPETGPETERMGTPGRRRDRRRRARGIPPGRCRTGAHVFSRAAAGSPVPSLPGAGAARGPGRRGRPRAGRQADRPAGCSPTGPRCGRCRCRRCGTWTGDPGRAIRQPAVRGAAGQPPGRVRPRRPTPRSRRRCRRSRWCARRP